MGQFDVRIFQTHKRKQDPLINQQSFRLLHFSEFAVLFKESAKTMEDATRLKKNDTKTI